MVNNKIYFRCCRLRALQLIAPIEVRGRQGESYRSPPVQRSTSTTPNPVFQYDNNTDLQLDNTGYLMTLAMLGEDTGC